MFTNIFVLLDIVSFYSRTGIVYNVTSSAVGVIVYKVVGNRYIEKRVNLRIEHVRHSKCRQEFLDRVKANHDAHVAAKEKGGELFFDFIR
jgi:large subunit ribosomal protein L21e